MALPSDTSSLLVPIHLDAFVWDDWMQNNVGTYLYEAQYGNLAQLDSPIKHNASANLEKGIHLHWALPDALTHGKESTAGALVEFPFVPNRWLIARFNAEGAAWVCKMWVVQSDFLTAGPQTIGKTADALNSGTVTSITLQAPGASELLGVGTRLIVTSPDGTMRSDPLLVSEQVAAGGTQIKIQPSPFTNTFPAGSSVGIIGKSSFLDPSKPSFMEVSHDGATTVTLNEALIGRNHTIEAWEASADSGGPLFLQAVGPGNVFFSAYTPFIGDVFSFVDTDLPPQLVNQYKYSYLVTGWYSDATHDPLHGKNSYKTPENPDGSWTKIPAQNHIPASIVMDALKWSAVGTPATPPDASLYHGMVADVVWAWQPESGDALPFSKDNVQLAVGNTAIDALAALIEALAAKEAKEQPSEKTEWLTAGDTLANLIQAAQYDLLDQYGKPGGAAVIEQQIRQAWFGSAPGGTLWEVVGAVPGASGQDATPPTLTPAQTEALDTQRAALNLNQRAYDEALRALESLQEDLYILWWKVGKSSTFGWGEGPTLDPPSPPWSSVKSYMTRQLYPDLVQEVWKQYCAVQQMAANLPSATDAAEANQWADAHWTFPKQGGGTETLQALGLKLKATALPRFWHPNDPVVLISGLNRSQKHGEDGRYNSDKTLTCRLPGKTITGVTIPGQPTIDVAALQGQGVNLDPCGSYTKIPTVSLLVHEAFFADPGNAAVIQQAVGGDATTIRTAIADLVEQQPTQAAWIGTAPTPFALTVWGQAWAPLFLEWSVTYYPTGTGTGFDRRFALSDWDFDGEQYTWKGTGFDDNASIGYNGRTLLTPHAPYAFQGKISKYLKNHPSIDKTDKTELEDLLKTVGDWDLLSQGLSGFTDQLLTLIGQETFPPPPCDDMTVPCEDGKPKGSTPPCVTALIGEQYHAVPMLEGTGKAINYMWPVRGGFVAFDKFVIVDSFGRSFEAIYPNTPQGFQPIYGQGLKPTTQPGGNYGFVQVPPRVVQNSRLDFRFLANDGSGQDVAVSDNPNAVCGWLLPNHLDGGISVYDAGGVLLGEVLPLGPPNNWRPRPGPAGATPPPATPNDIQNAALKNVVVSIAGLPKDRFLDVMKVIDETLWMVDPLGGRKDQMLSVLVGRPLAVVQAHLDLRLHGNPAFNRHWDMMLRPVNAPFTRLKDIGDVEEVPFPVRLGSLELRNDGLLGYFLGNDFNTFYAVHRPEAIPASDTYIKQIRKPTYDGGAITGWTYQGDITLKEQGNGVTVTMLVDPRGSVHAYTGILPTLSVALLAHTVEDFLKQLKVTFRTGPIIADPGTLRLPKPAEEHGVWTWIQAAPPPQNWETDPIVDADDRARLPDALLQLREGWLQLSDLDESGS